MTSSGCLLRTASRRGLTRAVSMMSEIIAIFSLARSCNKFSLPFLDGRHREAGRICKATIRSKRVAFSSFGRISRDFAYGAGRMLPSLSTSWLSSSSGFKACVLRKPSNLLPIGLDLMISVGRDATTIVGTRVDSVRDYAYDRRCPQE